MYIFFRNISLINLVSLCAFNLGDFKGIACLVVQIVWLNLNSVIMKVLLQSLNISSVFFFLAGQRTDCVIPVKERASRLYFL